MFVSVRNVGLVVLGVAALAIGGQVLAADECKTERGCPNEVGGPVGTPQALIDTLKLSNGTLEQIAGALKTTFALNAQQVMQNLKDAGYAPQDIAAAVNAVFSAGGRQIAQWLKAVGYNGAQIADALKNGVGANAQDVADWLKNLFGSSPSQLAQWLKSAGYPLNQVAQALLSIETDPQKILQALKSSYNLGAEQLVAALQQIQAIITPKNCGVSGCNEPARLLKNIGYALNDVLKALKTHFNIPAPAAYDIAKNVYNQGNAVIQQALAFAGYSAEQITSVIR